jgi:molybdate transport system substrate-binding protein
VCNAQAIVGIKVTLCGLAAALVLATGCGSDDDAGGGDDKPTLTVSAAASLKRAFTTCADQYDQATIRFSFAGSDELAAQIRQGAKPDVFAAANTKLPEQLAAEGRLGTPTVFAGNRLVIAEPAGSPIAGIADLAKPNTELVIGDPSVPIGSYTRDVLGRLPAPQERAIIANVRSEEPDVAGIIGKLTQGAADAGFTYVTDVAGTDGKLKSVDLPSGIQPSVAYGAGVVQETPNAQQAQAFIDDVVSGACSKVMRQAGFLPPPSP